MRITAPSKCAVVLAKYYREADTHVAVPKTFRLGRPLVWPAFSAALGAVSWGFCLVAPPACLAADGPTAWRAAPAGWAILAVLAILVTSWRLLDRAFIRRHNALQLAVRQRTDQLERLNQLADTRNRILEKLVSNEPLENVLEAIARFTQEQIPGASCVLLLKHDTQLRFRPDSHRKGESSTRFRVGAAPGAPANWAYAIGFPRSVPFEVWRQPCESRRIETDPGWSVFVDRLRDTDSRRITDRGDVAVPRMIRSLPFGDPVAPLGAILLLYLEESHAQIENGETGKTSWEAQLRAVARLAHIAIQHRRSCEELDFRANHDALTGLPNRGLFDERLQLAILEAERGQRRLALLYVDVDCFKQINDRFGHRAGDQLLSDVAARIRSALRPGDTVGRVGGDEFNVILPDVGAANSAELLASRIVEMVRQPVTLQGSELTITVSVGIAIYPDDGQNVIDLQREADAAMYYAKSLGKNRTQNFSDNAAALDTVRMEQFLRQALDEGWFVVHYQPKFTATGRLAGMEALLRMDHPVHGRLMPGTFIPVAESSGLIVPIGAWVLRAVCRQIAEWRRREMAPVVVAVNVSAMQMIRGDFAKLVKGCLASHAIPPYCLELEVTESMVVDGDGEGHRQMQLLRAHGVSISIDDFGTGFSSLSYLNRLQVDAVKLDRSFVQSIDTDGGAQHLVRAVITAAQGLGLDVIAEGVETEAQRLQLVAAGCPVMQGYLFARPAPPESVEKLLSPESVGGDLSRLYGMIEAQGPLARPAIEAQGPLARPVIEAANEAETSQTL